MDDFVFDEEILRGIEEVVCKSPWKDETEIKFVIEASKLAFANLSQAKTRQRKIFRLCGQSGSGKTTQLLPAITTAISGNPVILAVRNFVCYHPQIEKIKKNYSETELRERTNGFALKCLFLTLCMLVKQGFLIVYDVTLLGLEYEKMLFKILKNAGYDQVFNILAVNLNQSLKFIDKRKMDHANSEFGRVICPKSVDYFFKNLDLSLNFYVKELPFSKCVVWSAFNKKPLYAGFLKYSQPAVALGRQGKNRHISEKELLSRKIKFYKNFVKS